MTTKTARKTTDQEKVAAKDFPASKRTRLVVAMVTYIFPPSYGGAAIQALELAKSLKRLGVQSFFVAANFANAPACEELEGIPVYRFQTVASPRFSYLIFMLKVLRLLFKKRKSYDLIHFHSIKPFSFLITLLAKVLRKPALVSLSLIGNDDPKGLKAKSKLWAIEAQMYKHLETVNCVSTALKKSCLDEGILPENIATIPYGVDELKFARPKNSGVKKEIRRALGIPEQAFVCLFVGRVSLRKGCDLLFEAWREVLKTNPKDFFLTLVGPYGDHVFMSEAGKNFDAQVQENVQSAEALRMKFTGQIDIEETSRYFQAADCFVFPSVVEGFGIVVIEAMACGVPVIATRIEDVTEDIIDDRADGIILEDRDPKALAQAILELQRDQKLYAKLSKNAVQKVEQQFTLSSVAARHVVLYERLLLHKRKNGVNGVAHE
ncbi:MAG: glycosyltransferase family 4 protein [bacterium]